MVQYILPWPPSVNHYWFLVAAKGGGRKVLGKKGREFRQAVIDIIGTVKPLEGNLMVNIKAVLPDRRRRDIDNILKPTLDALEHAQVFKDDSQITQLLVTKYNIEPKGRLIVEIEEIYDAT